jgi:hypothetical protein
MTTKYMALLLGAGLLPATSSQATIILEANNGNNIASHTWTVSDLDNTPPTLTAVPGGDGISGTLSGAGSLSGQSFGMVFTGVLDWNATAAQTAIAGGTFETYVAGLTACNIDGAANAWGVNSGATDSNANRFTEQGEAIVLRMDTSNLASTSSLELSGLGWSLATANDYVDFVAYDVSEDVAHLTRWDKRGLGGVISSTVTLGDGDIVIFGVGASNGANAYRLNNLTMDVIAAVIPEPATLPLVFVGLAALCIRIRRT